MFEALLLVQLGHLGEHLVQIAQIHVLGWPPPESRGLVAAFDVETAHFVWNVGVLAVVAWLLRHGVTSMLLLLTFAWAAAHSAEHGYLITRAVLSGVQGVPGIVGAGGLLASAGLSAPGLTTWTRPIVHLAWNVVEVALLASAYVAFTWPRLSAFARRAVSVAPAAATTTVAALVLVSSATTADQPVTAHAPFDVAMDGRNELVGVAVAPDGAVYVSDRGAGVIYRVSGTATPTTVAQNLDRPAGLSFTLDGRLLIAEEQTGRILRLGDNGALSVVASGLTTPRWITTHADGALYVTAHRLTSREGADGLDGRLVVRIDVDSSGVSEVATGIRAAQGLTVVDDHLVVASSGIGPGPTSNGALLRYPVLRGGALGPPEMWVGTGLKQPVGLAVDPLGAVYVGSKALVLETETAKRAVAKIQPDTLLTDFVANLADPQGLALGHDGSLYVADGKSGRLYRFRAPPPPTLDAVAYATRRASIALTGTTEPYARIDVFMNDALQSVSGLADAAGRFSVTVTPESNALNTLEVYATAHGGRGLTSVAATAQLRHDDHPPTVAVGVPVAGAHVRGLVGVAAIAHDDGSGVVGVMLSAAGRPLSTTVDRVPPATKLTASAVWDTRGMPDGAHTLSVTATDAAGNESTAVTRSVVVDNTPPETLITSGPSGDIAVSAATFTFAGTDAITPPADLAFAWRLDGGAWSAFASATSATLSGLAETEHTFEVKARDRAGNEDVTPAVRTFRVVLSPVLTAIVPSSGTAGTLVTITGDGFAPGPIAVAFNGTSAVVRAATTNKITTTVPIAATSGPMVVTTPRGTITGAFSVTTTGGFAFTVLPAAVASIPGADVSYTLGVVGTGTFSGLVWLSVSGVPAGVTAEFLPGPFLAPGQIGELRLRVDPDAGAGTTELTITATGVVDGVTRSQRAPATLVIEPPGPTAVVGRFLLTSGEPLQGAGVAIGAARTTSDAAGNFLLRVSATGMQTMGIDANAARPGLPIYAMDVMLEAGQLTVLPTTWLTAPPPADRFVPIANATADQVITDSRFPGVAFTLPAGVTITGWDGALKTRVAIERIAGDRLPVPPPPGRTRSLFQLFFGTPMGGVPSAPLPVTLPNDLGLDPGRKAQLWYYDAAPLPDTAAAWRFAGLGTVSDDGQTIASDPGVGIARFCGVCGLSCFIDNEDAQPSADEGTPEDGEPVNLAIGQHLVDAVDLLQPGRIPAVVYRTYNPFDAFGRIGGFELVLGQGWALSVDIALLDVSAAVRRLVMPGNARYEFARETDGRFVNRSHPRLRGTAIVQEPDGVQALRFTNGNVWRFRGGWVGRGRLRPITGLNLLIEQRDRHDNTLTIARDVNGGVTTLTQSDGRTVVFTTSLLVPADPTSARLTRVRDALGRTVQYGYDPTSRRLQSVLDAAGGETRYTYDADGRLLAIRDQNGVTYVRNEYDARGRVAAQRMADGGVWRYAYEGPVGAHTVVRVSDPRGHTTTYRMGVSGRGDEVIDALGQSMRVERNGAGLATAVTDALGRATRIEYDAAQRPAASIDRGGRRWSFAYEPARGGIETITDPVGNVTRFEYDAAGNLTARVNPEGDRLEFGYDGGGAPTAVTDTLGRTTSYTYDAAGNVTSIRDPLGSTATFEHDAGARLVTAVDPTGAVTRWFHDALNRVTHIVDPAGGVSSFDYDAKGNLLTFTDARGERTTYTYDAMDRVTSRTDPLGRTRSFTYDVNGNVIRTVDPSGQPTRHAYDALNRRVRTTYADGSVVEYVYDALGRLIRTIDSDGGTVVMTYDSADRLAEEITAHGIVRYTYDALGRRRSLSVDGDVAAAYDYDRNSRLTTLSQPGWGATTLGYFSSGQLRRRTLPNGFATGYDYDDAGRVTRLVYEGPGGVVLGDLAYGYDRVGRRTSAGGTLARTLLPEPVAIAVYDRANEQLLFGDSTLTYDANGNATSLLSARGLATFAWDARDRLRRVAAADATLTFGYDALGRRTFRTTDDAISTYQYAGSDIVRETRAAVDVAYLRGLGADETLGQEQSLAYMLDGTRSTIGIVDNAGTLVQTLAYEPFGRAETSGPPDRVRYQFTGRERDTDWLYYYRARYYHPGLARFLQPDALGRAGGVNPYAYAANNPLSFLDPSGLRTYAAHGCCQSGDSLEAWDRFGRTLGLADPDVRVFQWSSRLFFDVIPSTKTPTEALLDTILRDLEDAPLAPGEKLNLVGHSAGGIIVNNVANALRVRGIAVDNLIMIGTPLFPGSLHAALPADVPITNFDDTHDTLSTSKHGPNVTNIELTQQNAAGTFDALTSHTAYMTNPIVINTIRRLIAR